MNMQAAIDVFSAVLTPVIAIIAALIACQQWKTNHGKLRLDLYDRRLRVYQAVAQFINKVLKDFSPEPQDIFDLRGNTVEAYFLFGCDIGDYLKKLTARAVELRKWKSKYRDSQDAQPEGYHHDEVVEGLDREERWFAAQPEEAQRHFGRYLKVQVR